MPIQIYDSRLSSIDTMRKLFEDYCKSRDVKLSLTTELMHGKMIYTDERTASAFEWFLRGVFAGCLDDFANVSN